MPGRTNPVSVLHSPERSGGVSCCLDIGGTMDVTKGVTMAEISDKKGADAKTTKVDAAPIHETQNEQETVPEHIEGTSQTPEATADAVVHPPESNEDEVKGEDNSPIATPHSADPQADPEDRNSATGEEAAGSLKGKDERTLSQRIERVSGDEVYGGLGAPPSTQDALSGIRSRVEKAGEADS